MSVPLHPELWSSNFPSVLNYLTTICSSRAAFSRGLRFNSVILHISICSQWGHLFTTMLHQPVDWCQLQLDTWCVGSEGVGLTWRKGGQKRSRRSERRNNLAWSERQQLWGWEQPEGDGWCAEFRRGAEHSGKALSLSVEVERGGQVGATLRERKKLLKFDY